MSDSVRPHRRQPTRLPRPWDSPGKNTGVGCHFLLQCMKVKSESEAAQSCLTLSDPTDCSLPGSSVHGIFQARVLEWGANLKYTIMQIFGIGHLKYSIFNSILLRTRGISQYYLNSHHSGSNLEKAMAPHSSTLAWKIPWMEEPGGLQSMGSLRFRHD